MIIVDVLAGFVIAVMTGLGIGGGGLLVIYLTLVLGKEQLYAQGVNLMFFIFSASVSLIYHFKKRKIIISEVALLALSGIAGALLGSYVGHIINPSTVRFWFGWLLIISGAVVFLRK